MNIEYEQIHLSRSPFPSLDESFALVHSQELDHYEDFQSTNSKDIATYKNFGGKIRVYDYLAKLNIEYGQIRVHVQSQSPFPSLDNFFALVHSKESSKTAMLHPSTVDRSALQTSAGTIAESGLPSQFLIPLRKL